LDKRLEEKLAPQTEAKNRLENDRQWKKMYPGTLTRQNTMTTKKTIAIRTPSGQCHPLEIDVENAVLAFSLIAIMKDSLFQNVRFVRSPYALSATIQHSNRLNQIMRPAFTAKSAVKAGRIPKVEQIHSVETGDTYADTTTPGATTC